MAITVSHFLKALSASASLIFHLAKAHIIIATSTLRRRRRARTRGPARFPESGRAACWPSGWRPPEWPTGPSAPRIKAIHGPWIEHVLHTT